MDKKHTGIDPGQGDYTAEYGNYFFSMPPCMMPDGGEFCKEYAFSARDDENAR